MLQLGVPFKVAYAAAGKEVTVEEIKDLHKANELIRMQQANIELLVELLDVSRREYGSLAQKYEKHMNGEINGQAQELINAFDQVIEQARGECVDRQHGVISAEEEAWQTLEKANESANTATGAC